MNVKQKLLEYLTTNTKLINAYDLSDNLQYHVQTVKSALRELAIEGKVEIVKKKNSSFGGTQVTNFYRIK